jgi:hypothetical protein
MAFIAFEYAFIPTAVIRMEEAFVMPEAHKWVLLSANNHQMIALNPDSAIVLSLEDGAQIPRAKFYLKRAIDVLGLKLYESPRGFAAALRQVPFRGCQLECHVMLGPEDAEVFCYKADGALMYVKQYSRSDRLTSATLNRQVKYSLMEANRASHNSVFSLHWTIGGPRINPSKLMWTPRRPVVRRRPAAGH